MIFANNISINLLLIVILTAVLFIYILAIYLYNIYVYINTILLIYNNEIKILFHFFIFISLAVFNNIGLLILEDRNEILLNFLAEINKDNSMSNVDYMKISEVTSGSRGRILNRVKTIEPTPNRLSSDKNNNVYRLNGGELLNDLTCRGKFERVQGTRDINFADFEGTTAVIQNGLKHNHESYIVMVNESDRNGFSCKKCII